VEVEFATKKLEKCYREFAAGVRAWGRAVARKYIQRVDILMEAANIDEIRRIPELGWHPLKGDKKGQFAMILHDRWRLTISLRGTKARIVRVEEVSKHYGD
jgi:proteic killer suppression protein